ncbi:hypothetical protein BC834DRAFT_863448 [Gloeopeniophorella convolvens]|nr:hypothetical protein BC834DRAFT_863448 [Gloeopeniophorella convolvens]
MSSSRRSSTSSVASIAGPSSPLLSPPSSPGLVLVNEAETRNEAFDLSSDDELSDEVSAQLDRLNTSAIPPLSPTLVFLYLSVPYLKLGPLFLPNSDTPLSHSIPTLLVCALFAALTRQMWYILARYLKKMDMEEIILDVYARGAGKARTRQFLRSVVKLFTRTTRILLATIYLRVSVDILLPLIPAHFFSAARWLVTVPVALVVLPFYTAPSLAEKRIVYATWGSLLAYLTWLGAVSYAHAKGTLFSNVQWRNPGILWQGITSTAFIFSSSWTLPLYAALRGSAPVVVTKRLRRRSFRALVAISVAIAVALTLPLCFFAASPSAPGIPEGRPSALIAVSSAANLILTIPAILITTPPIPLPVAIRRGTNLPISKAAIYIITVLLSVLSSKAIMTLGDILLVFSLFGTYVLPAVLHITVHYFKRPLAIVLPTSVPRTGDGNQDGDDLLQRKEHSLQRRRLSRRLGWDAVAWISALPLGAGGSVWAVGKVLGKW